MASGRDIRNQIDSIKKTQKITSAMELVAASKMRRAQERMATTKPYAKKILQVIQHLANCHSEYQHPFLVRRDEIKRVGFIIVTSDRGLCGGLNNVLLKRTLQSIMQWKEKGAEIQLCLIGKKAGHFFKRFGGDVLAHVDGLGDTPHLMDLVGTIKVMLDAYQNQTLDAVYLGFNEFVNTMKQDATIQQVLPLEGVRDETSEYHWDYIYEPGAEILLESLLTRYIESQIYQAVVENIACEQASRMVAMKSATDNAGELINDLQLVYNKARQAVITQEIAEIVSGAEAV